MFQLLYFWILFNTDCICSACCFDFSTNLRTRLDFLIHLLFALSTLIMRPSPERICTASSHCREKNPMIVSDVAPRLDGASLSAIGTYPHVMHCSLSPFCISARNLRSCFEKIEIFSYNFIEFHLLLSHFNRMQSVFLFAIVIGGVMCGVVILFGAIATT